MLPTATARTSSKQSWAVAHLAAEEPDAAPYLQDQDWDDNSTLASTPSLHRGFATILRSGGEPCHIIISVERKLSRSSRALRKLWKAIQKILLHLLLQSNSSSGMSESSTAQPSLGVNGVMV